MIGWEFGDLLAAAQDSQEWAVAVLWRDLHPPLLRYLRGVEPGAAEDIESETWLQAARDLHRFRGNEMEFRAWLFTIARHRLLDWRRHAARRPARPVAPDQLPESATPDDAASAVMQNLDTDAALALVGTLPPDQAEVILLRVLGGLDATQVASILGKRPGTVRVLQHRGLRRLAERLGRPELQPRGVTR
ncbi:MAG: RNA polymerase sigma factor [Acidimicrobiia bacterium]